MNKSETGGRARHSVRAEARADAAWLDRSAACAARPE